MGEKTQSDQDQITQQHDRWFDNQKLFFAVATDFSHNQIKLDSICLFFGEEMFQWPLPKNNFPWKILGVTWFKKTNVAIMPPKKIEYNWCNKWEVIFRHTFCSFEFCLYLELWSGNFAVNYVREDWQKLSSHKSLSRLLGILRRVGPTWSLAIKLAGNQMRSHHDLQRVSPSGGHLSNLGGQVLS